MRGAQPDDHLNHEAWAIPYADLLTLMLAFFVVMYAISAVDAGKYRVLSNSLVEAFGAPRRVDPIEIGDPSVNDEMIADDIPKSLAPLEIELRATQFLENDPLLDLAIAPEELLVENRLRMVADSERQRILLAIADIADEMETALKPLIRDDLIKVNRESYWLEIEINTSLLFESGSAILADAARPILMDVAHILADRVARIHVEGHTDDIPISNSIYPSNWELSSGRAATVVHLFAENGVDPRQMVAMGYGEFRPVASNLTAEGRAENRRVAIVVLPGEAPRASQELAPERLKGDYNPFLDEEMTRPRRVPVDAPPG